MRPLRVYLPVEDAPTCVMFQNYNPSKSTFLPVFKISVILTISFADPGCLSRIPDPLSKRFRIRIRIKEFKYFHFLTLKTVSKLSEKLSGMFIPDPDFFLIPDPDPGVKKAPDPISATLLAIRIK